MKTSDFDYCLPHELIAQVPIEPRDHSRLMVLSRSSGTIEHRRFYELISYLHTGDVLVFNDSRVIPARLLGRKVDTGGRVEILLLRRLENNVWEALARPNKRLGIGTKVQITGDEVKVLAEIVRSGEGGEKLIRFSDETLLEGVGKIPLPPYIRLPLEHLERYQTVYSRIAGSVAAPTAGLHFTPELIERIMHKGVQCLFVTLHVGLDTFRPVREEDPAKHPIHREYGVISPEVADHLTNARSAGRRIIGVGTTTVRVLEGVAQATDSTPFKPFAGWVSLFILPGYRFRVVDALITNFHLPRSALLMLVSAFGGRDYLSRAYEEAVAQKYRFYSFGDAMLVL